MVQITKVESNHDYVMVEFLTNGIAISTRVYGHDELTPQEIVAKGYDELKPHIQMECDRLGIEADHELQIVGDKVLSIEILGVEDVYFSYGMPMLEKPLRCVGRTLYGKSLNLTDETEFTPSNPINILPTESTRVTVTAICRDLSDTKEFQVNYKSLADIQKEQEEAEKRAAEEEARRALEAKKARMEEIKSQLSDSDYKAIKYAEGCYTDAEYAPTKLYRDALRAEYNTLEQEVTPNAVEEGVLPENSIQ